MKTMHDRKTLCPDSTPWRHAGYDYAQPVTSGVSISRLSGIGGSGVDGKKLEGWTLDHGVFRKNSKIVFKY